MNSNLLSSWQHLSTRVIIEDGDKVLCVDTNLQNINGDITNIDKLLDATGTYDVIISQHRLNNIYRMNDFFKKASMLLNTGGNLVIAEPIVASGDAWVNTLLSSVSTSHVRSPKAEEIISASSESLELVEYVRYQSLRSFPVAEDIEELINKQIETMPDKIKKIIVPEIKDEHLTIRQYIGLFVWQK